MTISLTIGELAKRVGINPKTIRYYEAIGLLPAAKRRRGKNWGSPGHRVYDGDDAERLRFIRQARSLDLSLEQIRALLERLESTCGCGCAGRPLLGAMLAVKLPELERKLDELTTLRERLRALRAEVVRPRPRSADPVRRPTPIEALFGAGDVPEDLRGDGRA